MSNLDFLVVYVHVFEPLGNRMTSADSETNHIHVHIHVLLVI